MKMLARFGAVVVAPLAVMGALSAPAIAAPKSSPPLGCDKQLGYTGDAKQKTNDASHQGIGAGTGENYPSNCDHYYNHEKENGPFKP